jgi:hypothetical protein
MSLTDKSPEEWPAPLAGLGRIWACASRPARPGIVAVKLTAAPGLENSAAATLYTTAAFRDLLEHLQAVADEALANERVS